MGDVNVVDVVAGVATGGLYNVAKSSIDVINGKEDILSGAKDALNSLGPWGSLMMPINPDIAQAVNIAGVSAGLMAGGLAGVTPTGFGQEGALAASQAGQAAWTTTNSGLAPLATEASLAGGFANGTTPAVGTPAATPTSSYIPGAAPPNINPISFADSTGVTGSIDSAVANAGKSFSMIPEGNPAAAASWWSQQPAAVKAAIAGGGIFAGGQMITGAAGGYFAGLTAEKKLQLEQLINTQNQTQRQYLNKNNQYAPLLKFTASPSAATAGTNTSLLNTTPIGRV